MSDFIITSKQQSNAPEKDTLLSSSITILYQTQLIMVSFLTERNRNMASIKMYKCTMYLNEQQLKSRQTYFCFDQNLVAL